ncbi:CDP-diacylglycerol--glycerol-3-phosphate 3-phosphatidyltransferase [Cellulomonas sp. S1-8]|uniref:CDP-diacylglycerol--glycerol-3-phosphate 3-phosphatidyltransferase n=1 Tax=Cellulomonas sp. S1-8 TaxID=2904790 RepID=UPI002243DF86|nr:CDP-diacylglycerol--glycerol-3-phosphate 3-phosphatidyltransferase [Cellulomonas sp. S1-8]UZN04893.1 CDP-diacylglycerol--glycerol-3-phosphate 3-phosphatidyltransferase [Cellulomonas sp. S1-8]
MVDDAPSAWNPANVVTVLRIAVVPVFAVVLLADGGHTVTGRLLATGLFVLAAASDRLDGWLARRSGQVTDIGKILDPIADKLLIGSALVLLSWLGDLSWAVTAVVLVRELGITVMRFFLLRYVVLPASRGGKLKTVLQAVAISLYLLPLAHLPPAVAVLAALAMALAVVVTLLTGLDYVRDALRIRRAAGLPPSAGR